MEKLTPRERRQARTREEILDAALALINEKGPDAFSLRALAERVDYSPAGLYEYFDGKDDIINAVCADGDRMLFAYLRAVPDTLPIDQYLVELGLAYIRFAVQNVEHFKLVFTYDRQGPSIPYEEYAYNQTRFKTLTQSRPEAAKRFLQEAQAEATARWRFYENLAKLYADTVAEGAADSATG